MITITDAESLEKLYDYHVSFHAPYFFSPDFHTWRKSFLEDVDGEGRLLFKELFVKAAYEGDQLIGFIQYGRSAFGFDTQGNCSSDISYPIIRNLYFDHDREDAGVLLIQEALDLFGTAERVYAFFHYFGMSCFGRHGKLFERHKHIDALLKANGFVVEHENVYYSSTLSDETCSEIEIVPHGLTTGNQQYFDFMLSGNHVGGCEIHFVSEKTAYLRWIYVNQELTGKGIGTKCMAGLTHWLCQKGITRFDTDTAFSNPIAQHFYEKTGFTREGITRNYHSNHL